MADESEMSSSSEPMAAEGGKRSKWMSHVKSVMNANKGKSLKQVLKLAAKTYKKASKMTLGKKTSKRKSKGPFGLYGGKKHRSTRKNSRK